MPPPSQSEETHKVLSRKQLVVLVRFKPGGFDTGAAEGMVGKITSPIEGALDAVEGAMASIPGLNMFIKEDKAAKSKSDDKYTYFKDYSGWDTVFKKMGDGLKEMDPENAIETFDFSSTDSDGRKKDAKDLFDKVKSKWSGWKKYSANIHFIGLGQGGNVVNECTDLIAKDDTFKSEKWCVKSIIYVATPLYEKEHQLNQDSLKGEGAVFGFGNFYDLTQRAIECFEPNEGLLKLITDSNKNTLSLPVGKVKLRMVQVLAILLSGLHLSAGDTSELGKFKQVLDEVKGMVSDILDLFKTLIKEGAGFVKLGDLPKFGSMADGLGAIPGQVVQELKDYLDALLDKAGSGAKAGSLSVSPADLAGLLNCLCPLFDAITNMLKILSYDSESGNDIAAQIIDKAGIKKVFAPGELNQANLPVDEEYAQKALEAAQKDDPDMAGAIFSKVADHLKDATSGSSDVSSMSSDQKIALSEAITCMTLPMLPTKRDFYAKLLNALPINLAELTKSFTADKLTAAAAGPLAALGIKFPDKLTASVAATDAELTRIKGYFDKNNFKMLPHIDTLYLMYNSHNIMLKKMYGPIANTLDKQTGYLNYMKAKGYDNNPADNKYTQGTKEEKDKAMPTTELEKKEG